MTVAVIAHAGKRLGGGLPELRRILRDRGVDQPLWYEVPRAGKAPAQVRRALDAGAELVIVWGGDGMVRRAVGELAGTDVPLAVIPAGTANLLASSMGIPREIGSAVDIALAGRHRHLDVGRVNRERFAVMAGAGFDAAVMHDADAHKERLGRMAYVVSGTRSLDVPAFGTQIVVDGSDWYEGTATCVLLGNLGRVFGGVEVFPDAEPDDGVLELGIVTAEGRLQWLRTLARTAAGSPERSPFVRTTKARKIEIRLDDKVRYELDGGARAKVRDLKVRVEPGALRLCVPLADA